MIDALRHAYANVILLSPSLSKGADVFLLAPEVDVVVLVCPHGSSDDENAAAVLELQRAGAEEVLVVVDAEAPVDPAAAETKQAA